MKRWLLAVVTLFVAATLWLYFSVRQRPKTVVAQKQKLPGLWESPDFIFRTHRGETVTKPSLLGQPYVVNFIFTTCKAVCPTMTAKMVRLQRQLPGVPMRFISVSVDPDNDTEERLAEYAQQWNAPETRWTLLRTYWQGLDKISEGFHIKYQRQVCLDGGTEDVDPIIHSAAFVLVDEKGMVRGFYDSERPTAMALLLSDARALLGADAPDAGTERSGEQLFHELSCGNCHFNEALAPPLGGLLGRHRVLDDGQTLTADVAYVRESVLTPAAKRVKGYPLQMPPYEGQLSDGELTNLV